MDTVRGDDNRRLELAAVARLERDRLTICRRPHDIDASHEVRASRHGGSHEKVVELDPADRENGGLVRCDDGRVAIGPFEIEPGDPVRGDPRQLRLEPGESPQYADGDAAAARFVAWKGWSALEQR